MTTWLPITGCLNFAHFLIFWTEHNIYKTVPVFILSCKGEQAPTHLGQLEATDLKY